MPLTVLEESPRLSIFMRVSDFTSVLEEVSERMGVFVEVSEAGVDRLSRNGS